MVFAAVCWQTDRPDIMLHQWLLTCLFRSIRG